ncbi:cytochrome P450 [Trematosphaeria pertusa]|uniref:Cytochrome P450 n=1 Tax=Trematosphaeria pertusa TaxID=390896 RepID=A0A6A6IEX5_9PLEO|nr:cytochrome P450 [Trematosphaeria pertusa]KAF2248090.1 cytochrome P450 [Trematosphaeria pertusa]
MIVSKLSDRFTFPPNFLSSMPLGATCIVLLIGIFLLVFRLWAFTIKPWLNPQQPRELPYWIPYVGHTVRYIRSGHDVLLRARAHLKNKREPFAITLITRKMYFIVDPADAAEVYKNAASFAFDRVVQQLQRTFGISEGTMMATWGSSKENDSKSGSSKARDKNLGELSMEFWRTQLVRQEGYSDIESKLFQHVSAILDQQVSRAEATGGEISLSKLTTEVIIGAALRAFFGESLLEMQPDLVETYVAFDKESWKLWFRWPFSKSMYAKKAAVEDSLRKWITLPQERRLGRSYIVKMVEQTQRALGTPDPDLAKIMNLLVYVVNANTHKPCYWALVHLLNTPSLLSTIQDETAPAFLEDGTPNLSYLRESTPWTSGLFHEALRYYSASASIRVATCPTFVSGKLIPANSVVFLPFRPQHYDACIFGNDVDSFAPGRFVKDKRLSNSPKFRAFSGGSSYCPGRVVARQECAIFIALLLRKYKVEVVNPGIPERDFRTPTKGFVSPKAGEDVILRLGKKTSST